jgi:ferredoxin-NADP reductase
MERAALLGRLSTVRAPILWRVGSVRGLVSETAHAKTILVDVPDWPGHRPGQHVDVRLTAVDGYQTERSYSIASPPEDPTVAITVERIDDGEVSPYLTEELRPGDPLELRGPIGGHFTWQTADGGPLLLIAGGSGLAPLMAMLRHRNRRHSTVEARVLASARSPADLLYAAELSTLATADGLIVDRTFTRGRPPGWTGFARRVDAEMLDAVGPDPARRPRIFVCGPSAFVERATELLVELGHDPLTIHTERFGPTGG